MSTFNIQDVMSAIGDKGILRPTKFKVRFTPPPALQMMATNLEFYAEEVMLPGVSLQMEDVRRFGFGITEKRPVGATMPDVNITFRCDGIGFIYDFLHTWANMAINYHQTNQGAIFKGSDLYEVGYRADYAAIIVISVYDDAGREAITVRLNDAYPAFVADNPLRWAGKDEYLRLSASFSIFNWDYATPIQTLGTDQSLMQAISNMVPTNL